MTWIVSGRNTVGDALIAAARTSQAFVIQSLDRTAGADERGILPFMNRVGRVNLQVAGLLFDDTARFVDDGYEFLQRLTALHREFAQRLFEVLDSRDPSLAANTEAENGGVLPFPTRRGTRP
jgi:hypothetical protein